MKIKRYKVQWTEQRIEFEVTINHTIADKNIKESVEFWMGWELHLEANKGDYTQAFLQNLGALFFRLTAHYINPITTIKEEDGYHNLIGEEHGVVIHDNYEEVYFETDDIYVEEVEDV